MALAAITLLSSTAFAKPPADDHSPTWFALELGLGPAFGTGFPEDPVGVGLRGALGVGGGFDGVPVRFYLMGTLRYTNLWAHTESGTLESDLTRSLIDVSADLRVIWTVRRFRIHFDVGLGGSFLDSEARVNDRQTFQTDDARLAIYLAGGFGYRFTRWLSANLLVEGALPTTRPESDFVSAVSRVPSDNSETLGWTTVFFNASFHF